VIQYAFEKLNAAALLQVTTQIRRFAATPGEARVSIHTQTALLQLDSNIPRTFLDEVNALIALRGRIDTNPMIAETHHH